MKIKLKETVNAGGATNLLKGTEHSTVPCPVTFLDRYKNSIWVMGDKDEEIRLHSHEYELIEANEADGSPTHPAFKVNVIPYNRKKLEEAITKSFNEDERYKGKNYELREDLALVEGNNIITDREACFYEKVNEGITLDVYRASEEKLDDDGNKTGSKSVFMFPTASVTVTPEQLKEFELEKTSLGEFMGSRFGYNPRIVGNTTNLLKNLK